ncbi:MAG: L-fucose:H+ symporter permease [Bacteroidota bacterium]
MAFVPTETPTQEVTPGKSYVLPLALVTTLFFLWGLANILNSALIAQFQPLFEIGRAQALLVETAFYFGYFTIAIPAAIFMEKYSYKKGILFGLILYAIGALMFIPAAQFLTFGFFLFALYIIASGLAFLETAANPYVTMLGKPESSVQRLNFSQMFNGLALIVGPILAGQFIFAGNEGSMETQAAKEQAANAVIFPYTLIAVGVLLIAILVAIARMPEFSSSSKLKFDKQIFTHKHLVWSTIAQFFYVGAQASIWGITINYIIDVLPGTTKEIASTNYMPIGTGLFVVGRVVGTMIMSWIKDYKLLRLFAVAAAVLCIMATTADGMVAVGSVLAVNFFMSIMFPTIFALGVKDLGIHMKLGSSFIIMAIVGGAVFPPIMGIIADNVGIQVAFVIPTVCFVVVFLYSLNGYKVR